MNLLARPAVLVLLSSVVLSTSLLNADRFVYQLPSETTSDVVELKSDGEVDTLDQLVGVLPGEIDQIQLSSFPAAALADGDNLRSLTARCCSCRAPPATPLSMV